MRRIKHVGYELLNVKMLFPLNTCDWLRSHIQDGSTKGKKTNPVVSKENAIDFSSFSIEIYLNET
ncbi:hypothetical protein [Leptospira limi]|uniref:Uncharacterized protein n=1 Tax=Leptospira limi TaxID=2950023 RepID=A0ABT3M057_9LEPT|nr:hypothetical protein [Leptospira limi]MCW7463007.1 hypothetical protein [Leptospira limi]